MARRSRGREGLVNCDSCGRRVPRDKVVELDRTIYLSTDLKTKDDVRFMTRRTGKYCPSCGKHKHIYEKKKEIAQRNRDRRD